MDKITFNEEDSRFHEYDWSPFQTYDPKKKFLGIVQFDPWHIAKYFMLGAFNALQHSHGLVNWWVDIIINMVAWWLGFEIGWRLFKRKYK